MRTAAEGFRSKPKYYNSCAAENYDRATCFSSVVRECERDGIAICFFFDLLSRAGVARSTCCRERVKSDGLRDCQFR